MATFHRDLVSSRPRIVFTSRLLIAGALCTALAFVAGCATGTLAGPTDTAGAALSGRIHGGQQPVTNATIRLYATTSAGYNTTAPNLLATANSDNTGAFSITTTYTCPAGQQAYIVATGGNPGLGGTVNNNAIVMMDALGPCNNIGPSTFVNVDEVTTVAAAYALSGFVPAGALGFGTDAITTGVSTSSTNVQGLTDSFANAANIVDPAFGVALTATPATGSAGVVPQATINSLADILQDCVNSTGTGSTACTTLFAAATPPTGTGIAAPVNVFQAAVDIAQFPGNNVGTLFGLISPKAAFLPTLPTQPNDWTVGITYTNAQLSSPNGIAIDASDNVWISGSAIVSLSEFTNQGAPLSPAAGWTPAITINDNIRNLAFDTTGNLFMTDGNAAQIYQYIPGGTATAPAVGTVNTLSYATTTPATLSPNNFNLSIDAGGNIWTASYSKSKCTAAASLCYLIEFPKTGTPAYTPTTSINGNTVANVAGVKGLFADARPSSTNIWAANSATGTIVQLINSSTGAATPITLGTGSNPTGIALDKSGNAWITGSSTEQLFEVGPTGTVLNTVTNTTGLVTPYYLAIDGNGNLFINNSDANTVAEYNPGTQTFLSPNIGFAPNTTFAAGKLTGNTINTNQYLAIDRAGALWVLSRGSKPSTSNVVQILGIAAPVNPVFSFGQYGVKP